MPDPIISSQLRQSLERLHAELAGTPRVDGASRQLLREVLADIDRLLAVAPGPEGAGSGSAAGSRAGRSALPLEAAPHRLEALAVEFEAEHPGLAGSLRQFVDLLGRAGV